MPSSNGKSESFLGQWPGLESHFEDWGEFRGKKGRRRRRYLIWVWVFPILFHFPLTVLVNFFLSMSMDVVQVSNLETWKFIVDSLFYIFCLKIWFSAFAQHNIPPVQHPQIKSRRIVYGVQTSHLKAVQSAKSKKTEKWKECQT